MRLRYLPQDPVERVKAAIVSHGKATPLMIASATGLPYGQVASILRELREADLVTREVTTVYSFGLTLEGRRT